MKKLCILFIACALLLLVACSVKTEIDKYDPDGIFASTNIWDTKLRDIKSDKTFESNADPNIDYDHIFSKYITFLGYNATLRYVFDENTNSLSRITCVISGLKDGKDIYEELCISYDEKYKLDSRTYEKSVNGGLPTDAESFSLSEIRQYVPDENSSYHFKSLWNFNDQSIEALLYNQNLGDAISIIYLPEMPFAELGDIMQKKAEEIVPFSEILKKTK